MSRIFSRMGDQLGVRLFERLRGGIELTENGRILYRKNSRRLQWHGEPIREIEASATGGESVLLSVSMAFSTHWLMPHITRLNRAFANDDLRF